MIRDVSSRGDVAPHVIKPVMEELTLVEAKIQSVFMDTIQIHSNRLTSMSGYVHPLRLSSMNV
jgi:hypothetical protein